VNRDCNPGPSFSIPGFGISTSGIPGSRDPGSVNPYMNIGTLPALLTAIMCLNSVPVVFNFRVGSQMATTRFKQSKTNRLRIAKIDLGIYTDVVAQ